MVPELGAVHFGIARPVIPWVVGFGSRDLRLCAVHFGVARHVILLYGAC